MFGKICIDVFEEEPDRKFSHELTQMDSNKKKILALFV